ncbi:hypothetical protein C8Q75DRAFT_743644 [Abortiporus biennis]|nr:hypothetical protein C8Q75DRAFT_743644 [Abortiporus biennis]
MPVHSVNALEYQLQLYMTISARVTKMSETSQATYYSKNAPNNDRIPPKTLVDIFQYLSASDLLDRDCFFRHLSHISSDIIPRIIRGQSQLRYTMRICRTWYCAARPILYDQPFLASWREIKFLLRTFRLFPATTSLVKGVHILDLDEHERSYSLRHGYGHRINPCRSHNHNLGPGLDVRAQNMKKLMAARRSDLSTLLSSCRPTTLSIHYNNPPEQSILPLHEFLRNHTVVAERLRHLALYFHWFYLRHIAWDGMPILPSLETLTVQSVSFADDDIFQTHSMPKLKTLPLAYNSFDFCRLSTIISPASNPNLTDVQMVSNIGLRVRESGDLDGLRNLSKLVLIGLWELNMYRGVTKRLSFEWNTCSIRDLTIGCPTPFGDWYYFVTSIQHRNFDIYLSSSSRTPFYHSTGVFKRFQYTSIPMH